MLKFNIKQYFNTIVQKLSLSFKRFPIPITMAIATVITLIMQNHDFPSGSVPWDTYRRLAMTFALGIPLFLVVQVLFERIKAYKVSTKLIIEAAGIAFLALYYLFFIKDMTMVSTTRYIAITLSFYFTFAFIPYFIKRRGFEVYIIKLITDFFITYLYAVILFLGLAAILFTIETLFSIDVASELYLDIWLIVAGIFAPSYFLSTLPLSNQDMSKENYSKVIKVLLLYIIMPLLVVYTVILYVYFGRIILTREWPEIRISHLVLWYGLISTFVVFLVYPIRENNKWARAFTSNLPRAILPLIMMMLIALGIRINAYGVTENRHFVLMAALWVFGNMTYLAIKRSPKTIVLFISIAIIFIVSVIGPINAYTISKYSQNSRFEMLLKENNLLANEELQNAPTDLSEEVKKELSSIVLYFDHNHRIGDLKYVPEDMNLKELEEKLDFEIRDYYWDFPRKYNSYSLENSIDLYEIGDYDYFIDFSFYNRSSRPYEGNIEISYDEDGKELRIIKEGKLLYSKDLEEIALAIHEKSNGEYNQSKETMTFIDESQQIKVQLITKNMGLSANSNGDTLNLDFMEFYLFVKIK
ncbi:DUF4153 domain-containing protein [Alkaliphilus serpentinus]|uniref:DUF4153 domain-containing protein n=1 Tax=Alkaliphilus serpentinus TaxID=1482731 RepID=A0A833HLQ2_9FIRM|nr:DUF4153 domain-containing protein [Alkaliphilus serpentinus]KAB3526337.1 DUF4153 domain-containing protein [Alkaliphilus serpentinus]